MGVIDQFRRFAGAKPISTPNLPQISAQYMRGNQTPFFARWIPALRDTRDDVRAAWAIATARATDVLQNSGWISGGVAQSVASTVGAGLRLSAKPDGTEIGWTEQEAAAWSRVTERRWETFASNPIECDLLGRQTIGQMAASGYRSWYATGEIVATLPYVKRDGSPTGTKVKMIPSHRLVQNTNALENLFQGVRMDDNGFPLGYRFKFIDKLMTSQEREVLSRDAYGRPQVIHVYDGDAGQVRGITPMAPVLQIVKQYDQLSNATLMAALVQSIFAATIESQSPTLDLLNALQSPTEQGAGGDMDSFMAARMGWYSNTKIDLSEHGKLAHLFPGEKLEFNRSEHPNTTYEAFANMLLREIARCLGVTFEQLTGNYTGATYSSVRMGTSETWNVTLYRRKNIVGRFYQPIYEAWLEEQIELGLIAFPGGVDNFIKHRTAASRADWRGPAKPQADDLKYAKGVAIMMSLGVMTADAVAAEAGTDWEDIFEQLAREQARREELGLPEPVFPGQLPEPVDDEEPAKEAA